MTQDSRVGKKPAEEHPGVPRFPLDFCFRPRPHASACRLTSGEAPDLCSTSSHPIRCKEPPSHRQLTLTLCSIKHAASQKPQTARRPPYLSQHTFTSDGELKVGVSGLARILHRGRMKLQTQEKEVKTNIILTWGKGKSRQRHGLADRVTTTAGHS